MASQSFAAYLQRKQRIANIDEATDSFTGIPEPIRLTHLPEESRDPLIEQKCENASNELSDGEIAETSSDEDSESSEDLENSSKPHDKQQSAIMSTFSDLQIALSAAAAGLNVLASEKSMQIKPEASFKPQPIDIIEDDDGCESEESESESSADETDAEDVEVRKQAKKVEQSDEDEEVPAGPLMTKNEVLPPVLKPSVEKLPPNEPLLNVGKISAVLQNTVVIQSRLLQSPCEALDAETIIAFADGKVLGVVDETFGPVYQPMYVVRFETSDDIDHEKAVVGAEIFIAPTRSKHILPQTLQQQKGTDASNVFDEELPAEQQEFSDDEEEAAFKRQQKQGKRKRDPKVTPPTPPHSLMHAPESTCSSTFNQPGPPPTFQPFQNHTTQLPHHQPFNQTAPSVPMPFQQSSFYPPGTPFMFPGQVPNLMMQPGYMNFNMPQMPMTPQSQQQQQQMQQMLMQTLYMLQQQQQHSNPQ